MSACMLGLGLTSGCIAIAALGARTCAHISGDLENHIGAPADRVCVAALTVLERTQHSVQAKRKVAIKVRIEGRAGRWDPGQGPSAIQGMASTHTSIRVGLFVDEASSGVILGKIEGRH